MVDWSPRDRFLLILFAGLAGGTGEAGFGEDWDGRAIAGVMEIAT